MAHLVLVALLLVLQGAPALGCGVIVSRGGAVEIGGLTAMIGFDGSREDIAARISYGKANEDFGWLMPVPALPAIAAADLSGFSAAARISAPPPRAGGGFGVGAGAPRSSGTEELSRSVVSGLEFVVLRSSGAAALADWMSANGFSFHFGQAEALGRYLDKGWLVVAARLAQQVAATSTAAAVRLTFTSSDLVYPLAAAGGTHSGNLRTTFFVITPWRPTAEGISVSDRSYSRPIAAGDVGALASTVRVPAGAWLTRYDSVWDLEKLDRDVTFVRSADQTPVDSGGLTQEEDGGFPLWIVPLAIVVGGGVLVWRRRRGVGAAGWAITGALVVLIVASFALGAAEPGLWVVGGLLLATASFAAWRMTRGS